MLQRRPHIIDENRLIRRPADRQSFAKMNLFLILDLPLALLDDATDKPFHRVIPRAKQSGMWVLGWVRG